MLRAPVVVALRARRESDNESTSDGEGDGGGANVRMSHEGERETLRRRINRSWSKFNVQRSNSTLDMRRVLHVTDPGATLPHADETPN